MENVLITGGSEGIGLAFAKAYAKKGYRVLLAARNKDKLEHAKEKIQSEVVMYPIDLCEPDSALALYKQITKDGYNVDILVNNAGVGYAGKSIDIDLKKEEALVQLNCASAMTLTKLYLKDMLERNHGEIINVCSTGAFVPGPYIASYYASKAFLLSYTEALVKEYEDSAVKIKALCPGPTDTAFYAKSNGHKPSHTQSAEDVVKAYFKEKENRVIIIPGWINKLARLVPKRIAIAYLKKEKGKYL